MYNLLKYDFKYLWRIWWIAAVASLAATLVGIFSMKRVMYSEEMPIPEGQLSRSASGVLDGLGLSGMVMFFLAAFVFVVLIELLVMYRYYKNFFTDEGYLTFTLPVTENKLLMGKSISGTIAYMGTAVVALILLAIFGWFALYFQIGWEGTWRDISRFAYEFFNDIGTYAGLYLIEFILLGIASCIFNVQLGYISITIGSVIAKKNKLLAGIGMFFAISMALSIATNILGTVGLINIDWGGGLSPDAYIAIALGLVVVFLLGLSVLCYFLNLELLKKRLNLA